ncbi:MAG TPA: cyclic-phosphate processing receiver domain-containing protein [Aridibacter sp.]|nr:cyclic-phosphate processing receiver domain-containing protein [Aridibacter sp.]
MKKILRSLLIRLGLADLSAERDPIDVFVLDDDERRHRWFEKRFKGDNLEIVSTVVDAKRVLAEKKFDAIFLDHDLLPHHYESNDHDDFGRTGYAVAEWLAENTELNRSASFIVHTRNADGGLHMVEKLRESGRQAEYVPFPMLHLKIKTYWKK